MTHTEPAAPRTYTVDIGPITIATHNTSRELALTAALYWLGENATKYGMDPHQHIMEDTLPVRPIEGGETVVYGLGQFPNMREFRAKDIPAPSSSRPILPAGLRLWF